MTDHDYYTRYLKREFQRFEGENPTKALIKKRYDKGKTLLDNDMGGVV
jgi:AraC-like DNA-binding protein